MRLQPITLSEARVFVERHHRHPLEQKVLWERVA